MPARYDSHSVDIGQRPLEGFELRGKVAIKMELAYASAGLKNPALSAVG